MNKETLTIEVTERPASATKQISINTVLKAIHSLLEKSKASGLGDPDRKRTSTPESPPSKGRGGDKCTCEAICQVKALGRNEKSIKRRN